MSRAEFGARLRRRPPILYALLDAGLVAPDRYVAAGVALLEAQVDILQLRAKQVSDSCVAEWSAQLLPSAHALGIPIILNDRVELARDLGFDGVHVGQSDMAPAAARTLMGENALIGLSTHSVAQVEAADERQLDYLGFGAIFPTETRENSSIAGCAALTRAVAASTLPLVAIGGIRPENVETLAAAAGVAVASGLSPESDPLASVRAYRKALASC